MAVKIRLQRHGKKAAAFFHIVIADGRAPRDGAGLGAVEQPALDDHRPLRHRGRAHGGRAMNASRRIPSSPRSLPMSATLPSEGARTAGRTPEVSP